MRLVAVVGMLLLATSYAAPAIACCGQSASVGYAPAYSAGYAPVASTSYYAPTAYTAAYAPTYTAAYAPTYTTAYSPVVVQQQRTGWYPGKWLSRAELMGLERPANAGRCLSTHNLRSANVGRCGPRLPDVCLVRPGRTGLFHLHRRLCTCVQHLTHTASYAPACETGCSSCSAAPVVTQVSYEQPAAATCCAAGAQPTTVAAPPQTYVAPPADTVPYNRLRPLA